MSAADSRAVAARRVVAGRASCSSRCSRPTSSSRRSSPARSSAARSATSRFVELVNTRNTGVAFGQLQDGGIIVSLVIALALGALLVYFARNAQRPLVWLPTGMLLGGALGNIVDRVREGAVIDYLKLPHWPAFNVADASITVGVVILLVVVERGDRAGDRA